MEQNLNNAFSLLVVGMITVFLILWLVVIIGNLLIRITNRYWPLPEGPGKKGGETRAINAEILTAIVAAVEVVTGGRGRVTKIDKE